MKICGEQPSGLYEYRGRTTYLLYSQASVFDRFAASPPHPLNANHFIAVVFENGRWYYDNNTELVEFTPVDSDVLVAEVDFDADTVFGLYGQTGEYEGIDLGYIRGDLQFHANRWGGANNPGEFAITGTGFEREPDGPSGVTPTPVGEFRNGVAARDDATGTGYILYSEQSVFDRFAVQPNPNNADHFIAVVFENGRWYYDNNLELVGFTPIDGDVLVAEVDFDADTVFGLYGPEPVNIFETLLEKSSDFQAASAASSSWLVGVA